MEAGSVVPPPLPPEPTSSASVLSPARARARSSTGNERMRAQRSSSRIVDGPTPKYSDEVTETFFPAGKTAVKVAVRVRPPLNPSDPGFDLIPQRFRESTCEVPTPTSLNVQSQPGKKHFKFDHVFDADTTQQGVWEYISEAVPSFVQGYNVSILAYGQSGAGKSYTMGTSGPAEQSDSELMGIVPRAAQMLFEKLAINPMPRLASGLRTPKRYSTQGLPSPAALSQLTQLANEKNWTLKATYVEIYNEQLRDLLVPESIPQTDRTNVVIREDTKGRILLTGLTQVEINSVDDLLGALNFGSTIRQTDATAINARSSRSHAVFSLNLVQKKSEPVTAKKDKRRSMPAEVFHAAQAKAEAESTVTIDSKLHFVDLAGSERLKNTGATGERAKEGISINAGLASLGKVISQLSTKTGNTHISYRDSRLTRLLQDSLGGNAITYMVACVNPAAFHMNETLNTLHYAQRARAIQSKPEIQQTHDDGDKQAAIDKLRAEVSFLRDQIKHSEHSDRNSRLVAGPEKTRREADLHMQLLDVQESYTSLSQRHAKLLSEISRAKDEDADLPMLKDALGENAAERLSRSNNFAEAVEAVVLEYEKTIQTLETSLSNTRTNLVAAQNEVLDKQSKLAYMDTVQQQLQSRVQKSIDRESKNESYLRDLEAQLDGSATGEEKSNAIVSELRRELTRLREGGESAEEYITTLEEKLAEAEQDAEIMQSEIDRLEHVVERQRSMGRLDNLLSELDSVRQSATLQSTPKAMKSIPKINGNGHRESYDPFRPPSPSGSSNYQDDEEFSEAPVQQPAETKSIADDTETVTALPVVPEHESRSSEQNDFMADKLENLTLELFDLRSEHESVITDFDNLQQKYQTALETLAKLEYDKEAPKAAVVQKDEDASEGSTTLPVEDVPELNGTAEKAFVNGEHAVINGDHDEILENGHVDALRREYQILSDRHSATLEQVEDLKLELRRVSMRPVSPNVGSGAFSALHRRKSGDALGAMMNGNDRASKSFTHLKSIAANNFEEDPQAKQTFDNNLNTVMSELNSQKEMSTVLEAELANAKKEMEAKQAIIAGLTRERSSLQSGAGVDFTVVGQLRDQLEESENQIRALTEQHGAREAELQEQIAAFKSKLDIAAKPLPLPKDDGAATSPLSPRAAEIDQDRREADREFITHLQTELAEWETRHNTAISDMRASEHKLLSTIADLESQVSQASGQAPATTRSAPAGDDLAAASAAAAASFAAEQAKHQAVVTALQQEVEQYKMISSQHTDKMRQLEESYNGILSKVDEDSRSKDLSSKELAAHKDLVSNLESQLEVHKSAVAIHQESLEGLQSAHSRELEELKESMIAAEHESNERYGLLEQQHKTVTAHLQGEIDKAQSDHHALLVVASAALGSDVEPAAVPARLQSLLDESKEMKTSHLKATSDLKSVQEELQTALTNTVQLENKIAELKSLHDEQGEAFIKLAEQEKKSSRLVEELEEQLNSNFDSHRAATHRLSKMETETSQVRQEIERELEEQKFKTMMLEQQLAQAKRQSLVSDRNSLSFHRESLSPEAAAFALARSASTSSNIRKSGIALPTPPPSIPLPPLPMSGVSPGIGPDISPLNSPQEATYGASDAHAVQLIEEQEARIRTIEKHLFAEKQLTATLEEALTDLENTASRTKSEAESWRKRCSSLEDEIVSLRKEKTNSRASLQAVEEEREMRVRAERARQALEQRMMELNNAKKKKKNALNCF